MAATIGVKPGNITVPITNFMKSTKEVTLTLSNTPSGWVTKVAKAVFYADSNNNWRMRFDISGTHDLTSGGGITLNVSGVSIHPDLNGTDGVGAISATGSRIGMYATTMVGAVDTTSGCRLISYPFTISGISANIGDYTHFTGDIKLASEPTTYTTSANMENAANIAAYIPFGQTGAPGETFTSIGTNSVVSGSGTTITFNTTGAPTLTLTKGKWDISGSVVGLHNTGGYNAITLQVTDGTTQYGGSPMFINSGGVSITPFSAIATITSTKTFYYYGVEQNSNSFYFGWGGNVPCGYMQAIRLAP